jgi:hypothetical protein
MKYVLIDPSTTRVEMVDLPAQCEAYAQVGLDVTNVDHTTVHRGVAIVVNGTGLLEPSTNQRYFQLGRQLYAGGAVLYGYDPPSGETIDMPWVPEVLFFKNAQEVERAIAAGQVDRPQTLFNGQLIWEWKAKG